MTRTEANSGTNTQDTSNPDNKKGEDLLFSYDDIELYARVIHRGREGYVIEKGPDVSSRKGYHMKIEWSSGNTTTLKRTVVNRYLRDKKFLWVDWDWRLARKQYDNAS